MVFDRSPAQDDDAEVDDAALREAAVRLLARREHARAELATKLRRKYGTACEPRLEVLLDELAETGLQSDARFAESFARQRAEKGYGPVRIRAELRQRGIDDSGIERTLESLDVDFFELARTVHERRFGRSGPAEDRRERARRYQALMRRGFSGDHLREIDDLNR